MLKMNVIFKEYSDSDRTTWFKKSVVFSEKDWIHIRNIIAAGLGEDFLNLYKKNMSGINTEKQMTEMFSWSLGSVTGTVAFAIGRPNNNYVNFATCMFMQGLLKDESVPKDEVITTFKQFLDRCVDKIRGFKVTFMD